MPKRSKVPPQETPLRTADGRWKKGHSGRNSGAVAEWFASAGISVSEARTLVLQKLVEAVRTDAKVSPACELLGKFLLLKGRALPSDIFKGCTTPLERSEAVFRAVGRGVVTPDEGEVLMRSVGMSGTINEWSKLEAELRVAQTQSHSGSARPNVTVRPTGLLDGLPATSTSRLAVDCAEVPSDD